MRSRLIFVGLFFLITACVSVPVKTEIQTLPGNSVAQPNPSSTIDNNSLNTAFPESTKGDQIPSYVEYTNGNLWLRLFTPKDGEIVTREEIDVSGQAPVETVISLNKDIFLVAEDGRFSIPVILVEGPNVIELVASNMSGEEIELVLTIVYENE